MAIVNREDFLNSIEFTEPSRRKRIGKDDDIFVNTTGKGDKMRLSVYFRNGVNELFGERVKFGRFKNRMIILPSEDGFKVTNLSNRSKVVQLLIRGSVENLIPFIDKGYELKYDELYEYYYIEREFNA